MRQVNSPTTGDELAKDEYIFLREEMQHEDALVTDQDICSRPRRTAAFTAEVLVAAPNLSSRLSTCVLTVPSEMKS